MANSAKKSRNKYISFGLPIVLCRICCTLSVIQFTLCKQFQKYIYSPDSSDLPVGYSGSPVGNQK